MLNGAAKRLALATIAGAFSILVFAPAADAAVANVLGGKVACTPQADGTRYCGGTRSTVPTFDGVPIDVNVALPPEPASGPDGGYPLVMVFHGYGGRKLSFDSLRRWTDQGYAAFTMSDRGFGDSCGLLSQTRIEQVIPCLQGWVRLMDTRYEVRDAQLFAGMLADEGIVDPQRIGATGGSYGGGLSMSLGALRDRVMKPDGSLMPWTSPGGTPMRIAAAAPEVPWTDLAYALAPNGGTLDYAADSPYLVRGRIGVVKMTFVAGLYASGQTSGFYAPPLLDPDADLTTWFALTNLGEPYDGSPLAADMIDELTSHHSSYYIDHSQKPAPMLISNGWTDDLFPPDEAIRFYNRTRTEHPDADISLFFLDYGHQRGQSKSADTAVLRDRQNDWFAHFLKGSGSEPFQGVEAITETCPKASPSAGPYSASNWAEIAPGEITHLDPASKTILPLTTDPTIGLAFDPIAGGGACAKTSGADQLLAASYRLGAAPAGGYTLMGSPTVIADISSLGPTSQLAARLVDVGPDGQQTLVDRGLWRPEVGEARQVFQLHPNGYRFEEGHVAKLELLPNDVPYGRFSNLQLPVTVSNLELRLPVLEAPGSLGGLVTAPAPKVLPAGYDLASDFLAGGSVPPGPFGGGAGAGAPQSATAPGAAGKAKCKRLKRKKARRKCQRRQRRAR